MARRPAARAWRASARRAGLAACLWLAGAGGALAAEPWEYEPLVSARYTEPTARYPHGALGDVIEYGALVLQYVPDHARYVIRLPEARRLEDVAPRLADVDGDGKPEAVVSESDRDRGARLAIYNGGGWSRRRPSSGGASAGWRRWARPIWTATG